MKTILIALAAATLMTSGATAKVISTHYSDSEAAVLSGRAAEAQTNATVTTDFHVGPTASMTAPESRKRSLVVSPHAE